MYNSTATNDGTCEMKAAANQAGRKIRSLYNAAADELNDAGDKVKSEIRTNPVRSSAIALGIGFVLASLLRR